jgi:hypothetical protein
MAVNLSPVGGAAAQFFDNSGNVLTGGKLYTYLAGTTTPAVTYTTISGITAHPNPIVLNAAGRVPDSGEIWLTDGVSYKFVLKDQNDVLIATYDNLVGINSNFVNFTGEEETQTATQGQTVFTLTTIQYLPATNNLLVFVNGSKQVLGDNYTETSSTVVTFVDGLNVGDVVDFCTATPINTNANTAASISYNEGCAGAVDRTVESKLQESLSVLDFGADSTGVADSAASFQDAVDCLAATEVNIPPGTYLLNSSPTPIGGATWIFQNGADLLGSGNLVGNVLSYSTSYAPSWVASSYNDSWGYMPPNSVVTSYPKSGNLGFTALAQANEALGATIGFSSAIENTSSGVGSSWCYYGTTLGNTTALNAATHCVEYDISAASTNVGTTIGIAMNAGGEAANMPGMGYTFQSVGAAIQIAVNNQGNYANVNFSKGIFITTNAIEPTFATAINLSQNHSIRWTGAGFSQLTAIQSTVSVASQATSLAFNEFGFFVNNAGNYPLLQINNSTSTAATNYFLFDAAIAGGTPTINAIGVDTNVDLKLFPKGSGKLDIASTGVVGTAGGLVGYLPIKVNGTTYKIPLYAV